MIPTASKADSVKAGKGSYFQQNWDGFKDLTLKLIQIVILFKKTADLHNWLESQRQIGKIIGFVPTMGALHAGHISLIEASKKENELTVASIFINPTQFNDPKDFEKYPSTLERDLDLLEESGCDVLYLPSVSEVYPNGIKATKHYELGYLESILEGKFRPGHFQGVCMVVNRLLDIVIPNQLYLGQKDYQQCRVIARLIELMRPPAPIQIRICPTFRENDGLAMSSRNMRLNELDRKTATIIYQSLVTIREHLQPGNVEHLKEEAKQKLTKAGLKPDYVELARADDLTLIENWDGQTKLVALIAAFLHDVRLIDNMLLN